MDNIFESLSLEIFMTIIGVLAIILGLIYGISKFLDFKHTLINDGIANIYDLCVMISCFGLVLFGIDTIFSFTSKLYV